MKVKKITFKNDQAWITLNNVEGEYIGTFHVCNPTEAERIKKLDPTDLVYKYKEKTEYKQKRIPIKSVPGSSYKNMYKNCSWR